MALARSDLVDVQLTGTPEELEAQLHTINILMRNADMIERGRLGEGYHSNRADQSDTVSVAATVDADSIIEPVEGLPVMVMSWVPESRIDTRHRAFVRRHVNRAAGMLGLDGPTIPIRWFGPQVGAGDFWAPVYLDDYVPSGLHPDDEIGGVAFNKGIRGDGLVGVIAHEVRHVQHAVMRKRLADRTYCEGDADDFAATYLARTDK